MQTISQEWKIEDINHDGTSGTVDLFPKYVFSADRYTQTNVVFNSANNSNYAASNLRAWLNSTIYNGFADEVKTAMKVQAVASNGTILYDKIKCPSATELGIVSDSYPIVAEGTAYPFGRGSYWTRIYYTASMAACSYWTRSTGGSGYVYYIKSNNGEMDFMGASVALASICIIRF